MLNDAFLCLLATLDFPDKYWALCDRFPLVPGSSFAASKKEILAAFEAAGTSIRYDSRDRSFEIESEKIGAIEWKALFVKQRGGLELMISGLGPEGYIGSNFAVLAYEGKRKEDTGFVRSPFSGPPPYPRPSASNPVQLAALVQEFVGLVKEIKAALHNCTEAV